MSTTAPRPARTSGLCAQGREGLGKWPVSLCTTRTPPSTGSSRASWSREEISPRRMALEASPSTEERLLVSLAALFQVLSLPFLIFATVWARRESDPQAWDQRVVVNGQSWAWHQWIPVFHVSFFPQLSFFVLDEKFMTFMTLQHHCTRPAPRWEACHFWTSGGWLW